MPIALPSEFWAEPPEPPAPAPTPEIRLKKVILRLEFFPRAGNPHATWEVEEWPPGEEMFKARKEQLVGLFVLETVRKDEGMLLVLGNNPGDIIGSGVLSREELTTSFPGWNESRQSPRECQITISRYASPLVKARHATP